MSGICFVLEMLYVAHEGKLSKGGIPVLWSVLAHSRYRFMFTMLSRGITSPAVSFRPKCVSPGQMLYQAYLLLEKFDRFSAERKIQGEKIRVVLYETDGTIATKDRKKYQNNEPLPRKINETRRQQQYFLQCMICTCNTV